MGTLSTFRHAAHRKRSIAAVWHWEPHERIRKTRAPLRHERTLIEVWRLARIAHRVTCIGMRPSRGRPAFIDRRRMLSPIPPVRLGGRTPLLRRGSTSGSRGLPRRRALRTCPGRSPNIWRGTVSCPGRPGGSDLPHLSGRVDASSPSAGNSSAAHGSSRARKYPRQAMVTSVRSGSRALRRCEMTIAGRPRGTLLCAAVARVGNRPPPSAHPAACT
jgi:hypothetical protein